MLRRCSGSQEIILIAMSLKQSLLLPSWTINWARLPRPCNNELVLAAMISDRCEVDTTSPFSSVKEAIAIFGERFLASNVSSRRPSSSVSKISISRSPIYSPPKPPLLSANSSPPTLCSVLRFNNERDGETAAVLDALRKLEAELCATRCELKRLRERQAETKVAVATLCLQLQRGMSMSPTTEIEAAEGEGTDPALSIQEQPQPYEVGRDRWRKERGRLPTLAQALRIGRMEEDEWEGRGRKKMKKPRKRKPIIPLIGDIFPKKKEGTSDLRSSLYSLSLHSALS